MITTLPCRSTRLAGLAGVTVLALSLAACSSGTTDEADGEDTGGSGATDATSFTVLTASDGAVNAWNAILETLAAGECAAEEAALPLEISTQQGATYDQQLQLLAGQDALPNLLVAAGTPALNIELADAGKLLDVGAALEDLGVADAVLPAAATTVTNLYDGNAIALPTEFNIEGIWYNKQILTDNRIDVPTTWVELTDAMATLQAAGVQPISAAGEGADGWGVSRWIGMYLFRTVGPDALAKVASGEASLTDPEYVAAADAISELGTLGYFGASPATVDYVEALEAFVTGKAAFYYMGSWVLGNLNDPEQNPMGEDNVGFMAFPEVEGGTGSASAVAANVGMPMVLSASPYDAEQAAWLKCIAQNYGNVALRDLGLITGLTITEEAEQPALTTLIQDEMASAESSVLWFEALFSPAATLTAQENAGLVAAGQMTGEEFMGLVQDDLG